MKNGIYVALPVEAPGFPGAHITLMYCEDSPLSLEHVTAIVNAIPIPPTVTLHAPIILGEGDERVVVVTAEHPYIDKIHNLLTQLGLKHSYPKLIPHVTISEEVSLDQAQTILATLENFCALVDYTLPLDTITVRTRQAIVEPLRSFSEKENEPQLDL